MGLFLGIPFILSITFSDLMFTYLKKYAIEANELYVIDIANKQLKTLIHWQSELIFIICSFLYYFNVDSKNTNLILACIPLLAFFLIKKSKIFTEKLYIITLRSLHSSVIVFLLIKGIFLLDYLMIQNNHFVLGLLYFSYGLQIKHYIDNKAKRKKLLDNSHFEKFA